MAIRSDDITEIIRSAIDEFEAGVENRSVGTVVEVGDGIATHLRPGRRARVRAAGVPRRRQGHGPQPRGGDGRRRHPGRLHQDQGRRHRQDHGHRGRGARGRRARRAASSTPLGRPIDDKGPIAATSEPSGRARRAGRHHPQVRGHARPDGHQGHRRAHPHRPWPARAHHRRPPDGQDRGGHRHHHQPEGQGPHLHLRGHRAEAVHGGARWSRCSSSTVPWSTPSWSSPAPRTRRRSSTSRPYAGAAMGEEIMENGVEVDGAAHQGRPVRLRRPDQACLGLPRDVAAAAPAARPRGLPRRRLLPPQPAPRACRPAQRGERRRLAHGAAHHRDAGR